jgi:hypothetical protein
LAAILVISIQSGFLGTTRQMLFSSTMAADPCASTARPMSGEPLSGEAGTKCPPPFTDMPANSPYNGELAYLKNNGIFKGYEDGRFLPDNPINRAELLKSVMTAREVVKGATNSGSADLKNCFTDVHEEWFAKYVCDAKNHGWIKGYEDGSFKPGNNVTKAEALKIMMTPFGFDLVKSPTSDKYASLPADAWYAPYVWTAEANHLMDAWHNGTPPDFQNHATRLDVATAVYRAMTIVLDGMGSDVDVEEIKLTMETIEEG